MTIFLKSTIPLLLLTLSLTNAKVKFNESTSSNNNKIECGDILSRYAEKPDELKFVKCNYGEGQTIVSSEYKVSGKESITVEKFLRKKYGLGKLKFTCCGWEPKNGKTGQPRCIELEKINPYYSIIISMFANAEKEDKNGDIYIEQNRDKIDYFTVEVAIIEV